MLRNYYQFCSTEGEKVFYTKIFFIHFYFLLHIFSIYFTKRKIKWKLHFEKTSFFFFGTIWIIFFFKKDLKIQKYFSNFKLKLLEFQTQFLFFLFVLFYFILFWLALLHNLYFIINIFKKDLPKYFNFIYWKSIKIVLLLNSIIKLEFVDLQNGNFYENNFSYI